MAETKKGGLRLFIAIPLSEKVIGRIGRLKKELAVEGVNFVERENMHLTLKFLGDVAYSRMGAVENKLRDIRLKRFRIKVNGVGVFPNESYVRVVWVGCNSDELNGIAKKINESLSDMFPKEEFTAHVTIARVKKHADLRTFLSSHRNDDFGEFEFSGFELRSSELTKAGPVYSTVARFGAAE
jgi:2'-5' RNA ligase